MTTNIKSPFCCTQHALHCCICSYMDMTGTHGGSRLGAPGVLDFTWDHCLIMRPGKNAVCDTRDRRPGEAPWAAQWPKKFKKWAMIKKSSADSRRMGRPSKSQADPASAAEAHYPARQQDYGFVWTAIVLKLQYCNRLVFSVCLARCCIRQWHHHARGRFR